MITSYKVVVSHEEGVEPDLYVNAVELVVNNLVRLQERDYTTVEWLPEIVAQLGKVAAMQLEVSDALKKDPHESVPDCINNYLNALLDLSTVTLLCLGSLTRKVKHVHQDDVTRMGQNNTSST